MSAASRVRLAAIYVAVGTVVQIPVVLLVVALHPSWPMLAMQVVYAPFTWRHAERAIDVAAGTVQADRESV